MTGTSAGRLARRLILFGLLTATTWILGHAPLPVVQASAAPQPEKQGQVLGDGSNRAALVVRYEDGSVETRCVAFSETEIRGDDLLKRSGLAPVISSEGSICSVGGLGCGSDDCFCRCPFPECEYWAYYHWLDGAWSYSSIGAAGYRVSPGALEGWSWGQGNFQQGVEPPVMSFEQICPATTGAAGSSLSSIKDSSGGHSVTVKPMGSASVSDAARQLTESRSFSPSLLPGYAAYMLALTILITIGWYVLHRRNGHRAVRVRESAPHDKWQSHEVRGRARE